MKRYLSLLMTSAMAVSMVTGCKKGGSSHTSSGGGSSTPASIGKNYAELFLADSPFGMIRAAAGTTTNCASSGTQTVTDSLVFGTPDSTHETVTGGIAISYSACVIESLTLGGGFTMGFNLTGLETPSTTSPTNVVVDGTISMTNNTLSINGTAGAISSLILTYSSVNYANASTTPAVTSGTLTYSGNVNGTAVSGTCNGTTKTCT